MSITILAIYFRFNNVSSLMKRREVASLGQKIVERMSPNVDDTEITGSQKRAGLKSQFLTLYS